MKTSTLRLIPCLLFGLLVLSACEKKDDTPPILTILGDNPLLVTIGDQDYVDPGATAADETDGDLTSAIEKEVNVNVNLKGNNYTITYSAKDAAGNTGTATRYVFVVNQTDYLAGTWNVTDNKIPPTGTPIQTTYQETIIADDTLDNRFWVNRFGNNDNARI
ncbi:MAG TPA: DUF5011 domain-containing protein, partial [Bacteroidales bacterium]|nr:DUF5011 domain-containing protein [Bacteroidales bacterium]